MPGDQNKSHLDDCPAENGALRVLPGTHTAGKLNASQVDAYVDKVEPVTCAAGPGDALVMRPLLVHASSASALAKHRRVLHFDYAAASLPDGMDWAERR
ncbi:Phytanoyl-CoA dioxygenase (PhyH) [Granulicella rosea]|uniref:Phytanoyl-CoA dioxygenase (PhyH) n=1 Tax=Granulicella rosea TaxID=474952 RepID=A0A239DP50_9BACT|nr:phytanoyl-CoA dioxygenase family protein [Granulicella rosea]SNS34286.1 Phytanoyl-CoA dioxygenase (PhyH) [Granulicella rosea]